MTAKSMKSDFGGYLRELRRIAGLTLKQVETKARVSNAYLSQIERGLRNPPHPDILKRLAAVYETPHTDLLGKAGYLDESEQGYAPEGRGSLPRNTTLYRRSVRETDEEDPTEEAVRRIADARFRPIACAA